MASDLQQTIQMLNSAYADIEQVWSTMDFLADGGDEEFTTPCDLMAELSEVRTAVSFASTKVHDLLKQARALTDAE